jgi:UDP-glucuronate decarboxylase
VNLGNPAEITMLELANRIKRMTGSSSRIEFRPLPEDDPIRRRPDITLAKGALGWKPKVDLETGLRETIEYFRKKVG